MKTKPKKPIVPEVPPPDVDQSDPFKEPVFEAPKLTPQQQAALLSMRTDTARLRRAFRKANPEAFDKVAVPYPNIAEIKIQRKPQVIIEHNVMWGMIHAPEGYEWFLRIEMNDWNASQKRFVPRPEVCAFEPPICVPIGAGVRLICPGNFPIGLTILHGLQTTEYYGIVRARSEYVSHPPGIPARRKSRR